MDLHDKQLKLKSTIPGDTYNSISICVYEMHFNLQDTDTLGVLQFYDNSQNKQLFLASHSRFYRNSNILIQRHRKSHFI